VKDLEEEKYNRVIRRALGLKDDEEIPKPRGKYTLKSGTFMEQVSPEDKPEFDKLYNTAPPKEGEEEGESKGVGNGEVALYWLYQFSGNDVKIGRSGDDPDLFINGKGVEVKAYKSHVGKIGLGRFGTDRDNLQLLSIIFGIKALSEALGSKEKGPAINPTNFKGTDLIPAFEQLLELERIPDLERLASQYNVFATIKQNIDTVNTELKNPTDAKEGAKQWHLKWLNLNSLENQVMDNYLANVLPNGSMKFFQISFEKLDNDENLLDNFAAKQSAIYLDFGKIFG
jgi:predicted nucleic acid-binding protein